MRALCHNQRTVNEVNIVCDWCCSLCVIIHFCLKQGEYKIHSVYLILTMVKKNVILTYFDNLRTRMIKHDILSLTE